MKARTYTLTQAADHAAVPYLVVKNAAEAIDFYERAFGAKQIECLVCHGKIGQAELRVCNSRVRLSDEYPETGLLSPQSLGGIPASVVVKVPNVDRFVGKAVAIGAKLRGHVDGSPYSDRAGSLEDPFGHIWHIATMHKDAAPAKSGKAAPRTAAKNGVLRAVR